MANRLWRPNQHEHGYPLRRPCLALPSFPVRLGRSPTPAFAAAMKTIICCNINIKSVCMCVCVCCHRAIPFTGILDVRLMEHQPGSHRIFHPPSFCGACLIFSRKKDSAVPVPRRPCSRILCTRELIVLHLLSFFFFLSSCDSGGDRLCFS